MFDEMLNQVQPDHKNFLNQRELTKNK